MKTSFNQTEITDWESFMEVVKFFELSVVVTGGMFNTHEINCGEDDFKQVKIISGN